MISACSVVSDSFVTPWTVAHQASLSTGLFRQEYWSRLPFPFLGDLPNPGIEPTSAASAGRCKFDPRLRKIPWRRAWQPTPVFLPGESCGQRSLVGYSP